MSRYLGDDWILPTLTPHNTPYFTAGTLQIQFCEACGHAQHPPDELCYACQGTKLLFAATPGTGRIESAAVVHHPVHPLLEGRVPYVVVLVAIDDAPGVRLLGNVRGAAPGEITIGARVHVVFEEARDPDSGGRLLIPQWELVPRA